jgi:hypothetical protein
MVVIARLLMGSMEAMPVVPARECYGAPDGNRCGITLKIVWRSV